MQSYIQETTLLSISPLDSGNLKSVRSETEFLQAIKGLNGKCSSPDGFTHGFYKIFALLLTPFMPSFNLIDKDYPSPPNYTYSKHK